MGGGQWRDYRDLAETYLHFGACEAALAKAQAAAPVTPNAQGQLQGLRQRLAAARR